MFEIKLSRGKRHRVLDGHPWVYFGETEAQLPYEANGKAVLCRDNRGRLLGTGLYNGKSRIIWRRFSLAEQPFDITYIRNTLQQAVAVREPETCRRLVWSESDGLPGLIVDQFESTLIVQTQTLGTDKRLKMILQLLDDLLSPERIVVRNDNSVRKKEGMELYVRMEKGSDDFPVEIKSSGVRYLFNPLEAQKTGFYLDQRRQHSAVAKYAGDKKVLDCFCNQGGFGLHTALAGAVRVTGVDSSEPALQAADRNAALNSVELDLVQGNVFDFLRTDEAKDFDLIVLDPPPFAPTKGALEGALRGYKEINLRALQLLPEDGILATYSCSHHVSLEMFRDVIADAANDAGRIVHILETAHQPPDHPVMLGMPESEYLKGFILRVQ